MGSSGRRRLARPLFGAAAALVAAELALSGCSLLITFDDAPLDGGEDVTSPPRVDAADVVRADVVTVDRIKAEAEASADAGVDVYSLDSCAGHVDGQYCGNNTLVGYPNKDDLVVCTDGKITSVRACSKGVGCIHLPDPHPDECDDCAGRVDGYYCGRQLTKWKPENANVQVRCMNGSEVGLKACTACTNGAKTVCP